MMPRSEHTLPVEDELDELAREISVKEREYESWGRAPFEGRMGNRAGWERRGEELLSRIRELRAFRTRLERTI